MRFRYTYTVYHNSKLATDISHLKSALMTIATPMFLGCFVSCIAAVAEYMNTGVWDEDAVYVLLGLGVTLLIVWPIRKLMDREIRKLISEDMPKK